MDGIGFWDKLSRFTETLPHRRINASGSPARTCRRARPSNTSIVAIRDPKRNTVPTSAPTPNTSTPMTPHNQTAADDPRAIGNAL